MVTTRTINFSRPPGDIDAYISTVQYTLNRGVIDILTTITAVTNRWDSYDVRIFSPAGVELEREPDLTIFSVPAGSSGSISLDNRSDIGFGDLDWEYSQISPQMIVQLNGFSAGIGLAIDEEPINMDADLVAEVSSGASNPEPPAVRPGDAPVDGPINPTTGKPSSRTTFYLPGNGYMDVIGCSSSDEFIASVQVINNTLSLKEYKVQLYTSGGVLVDEEPDASFINANAGEVVTIQVGSNLDPTVDRADMGNPITIELHEQTAGLIHRREIDTDDGLGCNTYHLEESEDLLHRIGRYALIAGGIAAGGLLIWFLVKNKKKE